MSAEAASFDCGKAVSNVEKLICGDGELSKLDEDLNRAYLQSLERPDVKQQAIISQKQWLKFTRNPCLDSVCLKKVYETRIKELGLTSSFGLVFMAVPPGGKHPAAAASAPSVAQVAPSALGAPKPALVPTASPDEYASLDARCPNNLGASMKFDVYNGDWITYVQNRSLGFGLNAKAITIPNSEAGLQLARLCDGRIVAVSLALFPGGRTDDSLYVRIYDSQFRPIVDAFQVDQSSEQQSDHSVAPLKNGGFVVTWRTDAENRGNEFDTNIYARLFDASGKPLSRTIKVSLTRQPNVQAKAYGLPNGGFVVAWVSTYGAYLRFFDANGNPRTDEIALTGVMGSSFDHNDGTTYGYVARDGSINLFFPNDNIYIELPLFFAARSYSMDGQPLTELLKPDELRELPGYQLMEDQFIHNKALSIGRVLPEFSKLDRKGPTYCGLISEDGPWADKLRKYTKDAEVLKLISRVGDALASCKAGIRY